MLSTLLALFLIAATEPTTQSPNESKTLWIVKPLYPGQQFLVSRSEQALQRLLNQVEGQVVGSKALLEHLQTQSPELDCLAGQKNCGDPVDALMSGFGFDRVVMLKGAQEDSSYRFQVTNYLPVNNLSANNLSANDLSGSGEVTSAEGAGPSLEKALIASLVKVVPLMSSIKVSSEPAGATVFIDGEKVGETPYAGQVLPGERTLKLDASSHMPIERKFEAPVRGNLEFSESLKRVPARLVIVTAPAGVSIELDGKNVGKDKVDTPVKPGTHRVSLTLEGHQPFSDVINVLGGTTFTLEKKLSLTNWSSFRQAMHKAQEEVYSYRSYFRLNYEQANMRGDSLYAQKNINKKYSDPSNVLARNLLDKSPMSGFSVEYGQNGRHFGVLIVGASYYKSSRPWRYTIENSSVKNVSESEGRAQAVVVRAMQPNVRFALWRLVFSGQMGMEVRSLKLDPIAATPEQTSLWFVDAQLSAQVVLQAFIYKGLYVDGAYRHSWSPFADHAAFKGFQLGAGYAF